MLVGNLSTKRTTSAANCFVRSFSSAAVMLLA
jgi:hypothetical protein